MRLRLAPTSRLGVVLLPLVLVACGGEVLKEDGFHLRCDLGCGPEGPAILQGMIDARDSVSVWLQGSVPGTGSEVEAKALLKGRVRLYGSKATFERVDARLTGGRYREQRAFSHARSRSAHILPEELPDQGRWERFGPGIAGPRLAVHEAGHLAIYGLAQDPRWPAWVSEGIAGVLEERWARGREGEDAWLHTRDHVRQVLLHRGDLPEWDAILDGALDRLPLSSRYAVWAGFMEVLLSAPFREDTQQALAVLAATPPAEGWSAVSVREVFERTISPERRRAIDERFREEIQKRNPRWVELARGSQVTQAGRLQVAADGNAALLWHLPDAADALDSACLSVSGMRVGGGELALVLLLGQDEGVAEGVAVGSGGVPTPFSLRLGVELPDAVVPGYRAGMSVPSEEILWIPTGEPFQLIVRRDGQTFVLRNHKGESHRWEAAADRLGPGWGFGVLGMGGVLWEQILAECPEQDFG